MSFIIMMLRKMLKNKSLTLCLFLGIILSVGLLSSIPLFTQAVLQKSMIKDLENSQSKELIYPGSYTLKIDQNESGIRDRIIQLKKQNADIDKNKNVILFYNTRLDSLKKINQYIIENTERLIGLPAITQFRSFSTDTRKVLVASKRSQDSGFGILRSLSDISRHIVLTDGRMPSNNSINGVYEVLVSEETLKKYGIVLNEAITLKDANTENSLIPIEIRPVGVFKEKDLNDMYWSFNKDDSMSESFIINETPMLNDIIFKQPDLAVHSLWFYAFDYHKIKFDSIKNILDGCQRVTNYINKTMVSSSMNVDAPKIYSLGNYAAQSKKVYQMLWSLYIPILVMLGMYLIMVSRLILEQERNEISLINSRGGNRLHIVAIYTVQGLLLGSAAFITGPWLGMLVARVTGYSSGFLEFSSRKSLPVDINETTYLFGAVAIIFSTLMIAIPAFFAGKTNIVKYKQMSARKSRFTLWEKIFLDVILLGITAYGYRMFTQRQKVLSNTGVIATLIKIDPLLFVIPIAFIIGIGLLLLRIYPILLKIIYWAGKRFWTPEIYLSLNQIGRSLRKYHFLMIFLIITLSVGIFSSTTARTINRNAEEKVMYGNGSDVAITPDWRKMDITTGQVMRKEQSPSITYGHLPPSLQKFFPDPFLLPSEIRFQFLEPDFGAFSSLEGVEQAARVLTYGSLMVKGGNYNDYTKMIAVDPYDFSRTAWFRDDLMKHSLTDYLNVLNTEPNSCFISRSMSKASGLKIGDTIQASYSLMDVLPKECIKITTLTIRGIIDYWPSWNPFVKNESDFSYGYSEPILIVANLQYIQDNLGIQPYDVWLKLKPGTSINQVYNGLVKQKISYLNLIDSNEQISRIKTDPGMVTVNGALTMGFIISILICFFGFLIYWTLSIKSRVLQFGIFRAIGLSLKRIIGMIIFEQILVSMAAAAAGIFIGLVTSRLFVPFFQMVFDAKQQVPPFRVIAHSADRMQIYILIGISLLVCLSILGLILSRLKVSQAIKLGEE
ncbi:MAG: FtsX-like permease family protein [Bacillota bacterium]|nr:FtsX-like permease family protein [Bacillota bacterium]